MGLETQRMISSANGFVGSTTGWLQGPGDAGLGSFYLSHNLLSHLPVWGGFSKAELLSLLQRCQSDLVPSRCEIRSTDGKECRANRINQFVCQLAEEFYTPVAVLKPKTEGVPCAAEMSNVPCAALHLQCLKLTKQEKIDFRAQVNIDSTSKCFKQSYSFSSPEQEFPISDSWSLENGTAQLWHLSSHTATAQQGHSHVLLPNPPLPTCLQAKEFQNKAQHVTGWLICLGNVIFPIWCTLEEWSHLKRGGIAQPSTLWQFSHN